ncbi:hypothetical protein QYF61_004221 [Mycteria americana]|uniref:Uncharacterized protein n=1 Tax=Mycteria americana TaxID=33587 RepID=A0AAN7N8Q0_MYCAM|nr:hypothetical protein QYF61_004221 [Mycteria americana]
MVKQIVKVLAPVPVNLFINDLNDGTGVPSQQVVDDREGLGSIWLRKGSISAEMDLDVLVGKKWTRGQQHALAAKASYILGCISKKGQLTAYVQSLARSRKVTHPLYLALVRLHVEYCVWFWVPLYKKGIDILEGL